VSRAIELSPKDANAYHRRVWIRYKQRQFKEAISDFEKVIELNPDDVDFLYQLGQFIFFTSVGGENKRRSLELTKKAVRLAPQVARYHASLGRIYWDVLKDRKLAIDELDKAIELDPNLVTAYVQRKIVYESIDLPRALEEINTALQLDPESAYALRHRGAIYNTLGRLDEALSDYNESERFKPHDCLVYLGRGELYLRREQYEAALSDLNKSIELDATRYHVYKRRALAHFHLGHYDEALSDIAKAVELNPRDTSNLRWGWLDDLATCPDEGFREGLLALADKTIELTDHSARAYAMRGWILAVLGQEEKALADLKTAFSKLPNADESGELSSSSSCYELGKLCGQLAHRQEVTPYLAKMPEIQPENTIHSYRAALAQLGAGQTDSYRDTCRGMLQQFQDTEM
jgi:tetratricopeptide (TPR) repeat protein